MTKKEMRNLEREKMKKIAEKMHGSLDEKQIFSIRKPEFCLQVYPRIKSNEERKEDVISVLEQLVRIFKLSPQVLEDCYNGIIDIVYLDSDFRGHILHLEEDKEFMDAANEIIRITDAMPFLGIKWDGQASPVFSCITDSPECIGMKEIPQMTSGSETGGLTCRANYRYYHLGVYFWFQGRLCDDYIEIEGHDGVIYPVIAFPDLQEQDGIKITDVTFI